MEIPKKALDASQPSGNLPGGSGAHSSAQLLAKARADTDTVLQELGSQLAGLSKAEADSRLKQVGTNGDCPGEASIGPDAPPEQYQ